MGDRANIRIKMNGSQANGDVFLYTHWGGEELPDVLAAALARQERWDDETYLARIIFCQMLLGDGDTDSSEGLLAAAKELKEPTGFGIGTYAPDNEHTILTVDCRTQTVNDVPFIEFIANPRDDRVGWE